MHKFAILGGGALPAITVNHEHAGAGMTLARIDVVGMRVGRMEGGARSETSGLNQTTWNYDFPAGLVLTFNSSRSVSMN